MQNILQVQCKDCKSLYFGRKKASESSAPLKVLFRTRPAASTKLVSGTSDVLFFAVGWVGQVRPKRICSVRAPFMRPLKEPYKGKKGPLHLPSLFLLLCVQILWKTEREDVSHSRTPFTPFHKGTQTPLANEMVCP